MAEPAVISGEIRVVILGDGGMLSKTLSAALSLQLTSP